MTSVQRRKVVFINTAIITITVLVMLILSELFVRALYADTTVLFPRYHTDVKYGEFVLRRIRPNADFWHKSVDGSWQFVTNSRGFRNYVDFEYEKPANTIRILSLGDSHTQGFEVRQDYTFSSIVERYLLRENYRAEVLNTGVSGFSTSEELIFLENEGIKYDPDVVLLGFFRNDFEDNIKSGLFRLDDDNILVIANKQHTPGVRTQNFIYSIPGVRWASENSYFYSIFFNATWNYFKKLLARSRSEESEEFAVATQATFSNYQLELTAELLRRMYEFCSANGIKLVIIDIPARNRQNEMISSFPSSLYPIVRRYSDAYIDSTSLLAKYSEVAEIHVPHGHRHISEFTHSIIGVAAAEEIRSLLGTTQDLSRVDP